MLALEKVPLPVPVPWLVVSDCYIPGQKQTLMLTFFFLDEAMQRGRNQQQQNVDDGSPVASNDPYQQDPQQTPEQSPWGESNPDWWNEQPQDQNDPWNQGGTGGAGGQGGDGGGDGGFDFDDWF